jgi:hypothetical protein
MEAAQSAAPQGDSDQLDRVDALATDLLDRVTKLEDSANDTSDIV